MRQEKKNNTKRYEMRITATRLDEAKEIRVRRQQNKREKTRNFDDFMLFENGERRKDEKKKTEKFENQISFACANTFIRIETNASFVNQIKQIFLSRSSVPSYSDERRKAHISRMPFIIFHFGISQIKNKFLFSNFFSLFFYRSPRSNIWLDWFFMFRRRCLA